jgi:predicted permease
MAHLLADFRYALRMLRKSPIFTIVAVLSIALGLGANTAIFTLVDQTLLRLLPVKDPQQLVLLRGEGKYQGNWQGDMFALPYPQYVDFRDHNDVFSGMFGRRNWGMAVSYKGRTERVAGELVTGTFFNVLGVNAALGRVLTPEDDQKRGAHPVAVISYSYWQSRFAGDPNIVGQKIILNSYPFTIVGVSEQGFDGIDLSFVPQIRVPMMMAEEITASGPLSRGGQSYRLEYRQLRWIHIFGRMKPGVTIDQVKARLQPLYHSMLEMDVKQEAFNGTTEEARKAYLAGTIEVLPGSQGRPELQRTLARPLWVLMAIVAGLLLIACANVANLLLARASARQREVALRLALGASRARIVQQLLVESLVLAIAGSALGLVMATWGANLLLGFLTSPEQSFALSASPDARIVAFNFGIALLTGLLFGLAPALQSTRPELAPTLKDHAGSVLGGAQVRLRKALVVSQVALSLLLLIGAGLFVRSLQNLLSLDPGFKTANLVTFNIDPRLNGYTSVRAKELFKSLQQRLATTPGVESASMSSEAVLTGDQWLSVFTVEGHQAKPGSDRNSWVNTVTPGYFETFGVPLIAGRTFRPTDERTRTLEERQRDSRAPMGFRVAVVNESFVKTFFEGENPIGRHVGFGTNPGTPTPIEIIGVVKDAKYTGMRDAMPPTIFFPVLEGDFFGDVTVYVRTTNPPAVMFNLVRQTMSQLDPNMPISAMATLDETLQQSLSNERLMASLSGIFSGLATLLAMIGLYGVMAYTVSRRTREIGIRMALGAVSGNIAWLVMREVLVLVAIGMIIAGPIVWGLSRYVQSQLYGITPADPATLAGASIALAAVAALAGLIPALRAARVNPIAALRYE